MHILLIFSVYKMYIVALLLSTSHRLCKTKRMDIYFLTLAQESNTAHYHKYCSLFFDSVYSKISLAEVEGILHTTLMHMHSSIDAHVRLQILK